MWLVAQTKCDTDRTAQQWWRDRAECRKSRAFSAKNHLKLIYIRNPCDDSCHDDRYAASLEHFGKSHSRCLASDWYLCVKFVACNNHFAPILYTIHTKKNRFWICKTLYKILMWMYILCISINSGSLAHSTEPRKPIFPRVKAERAF